jgi:hypothetical protein
VSEGTPEIEPLPPIPSEKKPEREGLPAGYRMRADAHYVDSLSGRRSERVYTDQPRVPASDAGAESPLRDRRDVRERRTDRVLAQIAEEVSAIEAATALLKSPGQTQRTLAADLLQIHAGRAAWLSGANTLLEGSLRAPAVSRPVGMLYMQIRESLAAECRAAGVSLQIKLDDWNARVIVHENEFRTGVSGAVRAILAALPDADTTTIRLTASVTDETVTVVEVTQEQIQIPAATSHRFFDLSWTDRPGGWLAAFAATTARALAQRDGGTAALEAGERRGGTLRLTLSI